MEKEKRPYITCSQADSGKLLELARYNRKYPTEAEQIMWELLRDKFFNVKFRRQHVIDHYIADFISLAHHLVIEIDGGYHFTEEQEILDKERTEYLNAKGLTVLRFTNEEVLNDTYHVLDKIKNFLIKELT